LAAYFKEIQQLLTTKTFHFVKRSKAKKLPITTKPITKLKKNPQGKVTKFKVRLVAKGFQQAPGINFRETFTTTTIPST